MAAETASDCEQLTGSADSSSEELPPRQGDASALERLPWVRQFRFLQREVGSGVLYIGVACFFFQVMGELLPRHATAWIFKSRHVDAATMQQYGIYFAMTEVFKLCYGIASSVFPIGGLTMRPYAVPGVLMMIGCNAAVFMFQGSLPTGQFVAARFLTWGAINYLNLITDTALATIRNEKPNVGPSLYSFFTYSDIARSIVLALLGARLIEWNLYSSFGVATILSMSLLPAVTCNLYPEREMSPKDMEMRRESILKDSDVLLFTGALLGVAAYNMIMVTMMASHPYLQCFVVWVGIGFMCLCWCGWANSDLAAMMVYYCVSSCVEIRLDTAVFYFYTDEEDVFPGGPHFGPTFMVTVVPLLGAALSFLGLTLYNAFMTEWNFRTVVRIPLCTKMILHFVDIIMFSRLNVRAGIPDWLFVFGHHALADVLEAWSMVVSRQIVARLCPPGMEAAVLSLFWFSVSMTGAGSGSTSAALMHAFGVNPNGTTGDVDAFQNMWSLSVLSGLGVLLQLALVNFAIPDAPQQEPVERVRRWNDASLLSKFRAWRAGAGAGWSAPAHRPSPR